MVDLVRAEIVEVADPQNSGRVQLRAPAMGEDWRAWAQALRPNGAADAADFRQGDVVFIAFEGGDPELPVVLGALAGRAAQTEESGAAAKRSIAPLPRTDLTLDDVVLPKEARAAIEEIIAWVRHGPVLRGEWSFGRHLKPGLRALFFGPPGTGKTMAAEVIASEVGLPIFQLDLSRLVSKYIGETEKSLNAFFALAEASSGILFFDEADALFGKRSGAKDSHDRFANLEIGYLLQRIETFPGLVILASNSKHNIEPAFLRRLDRVVSFPIPNAERRLQLWQRLLQTLPPERLGALDLDALSRDHALSGGTIVKVLRDVSLRALDVGTMVGEAELRKAIRRLRSDQTATRKAY